jgi:IS4 transposase
MDPILPSGGRTGRVDLISKEVLERIAQYSPITLMARLAMDRAVDPKWIDEVFKRESQSQYTRELLFSTTVEVMSLVVSGLRPSVHAAAKSVDLPVTVQALYGKLKKAEPQVIRALVGESAQRLISVVRELAPKKAATVKGFRLRITDGNHLPASEKRLRELREVREAALPGQSLVVYDPDLGLVVDVLPWEDAHTQERVLMKELIEKAVKGELWLMDRNFCTGPVICGFIERESHFLVREHAANPNPKEVSKLKRIGRIETGVVFEQIVSIEDEAGNTHPLRRIELRLDIPTDDGDRVIRLLTNLPKYLRAKQLARLYRRRWRIENMFQRLESVLNSEVRTLGVPGAALLAFGVALLTYNVLALLQTAVSVKHVRTLDEGQMEISTYYIAAEIRAYYAGMLLILGAAAFEPYQRLSDKQFAALLLKLSANVDPKRFRSHPRGPKAVKKKGYVSRRTVSSHVATARLLNQKSRDQSQK